MKVAILLATYNGEKYLKKQLDSLYNQTYLKWELYVHDDGSTDNTLEILKQYMIIHKNIRLFTSPVGCGAKNSFMFLINNVFADYYFLCDQDDVWHKDKIQKSLACMFDLENKHKETPIIVHSDLCVVDENLNMISGSFWRYMMIYPEKLVTFDQLGANSLVTGCTMLFNNATKNVIKHPAVNATMHDVWIALCVSKNNGIIYNISTPLIDYRQHKNNTLGAKNMKKQSRMNYKIRHLKTIYNQNKEVYKMLCDLEYGSIIKYIYYKLKYRYSK